MATQNLRALNTREAQSTEKRPAFLITNDEKLLILNQALPQIMKKLNPFLFMDMNVTFDEKDEFKAEVALRVLKCKWYSSDLENQVTDFITLICGSRKMRKEGKGVCPEGIAYYMILEMRGFTREVNKETKKRERKPLDNISLEDVGGASHDDGEPLLFDNTKWATDTKNTDPDEDLELSVQKMELEGYINTVLAAHPEIADQYFDGGFETIDAINEAIKSKTGKTANFTRTIETLHRNATRKGTNKLRGFEYAGSDTYAVAA